MSILFLETSVCPWSHLSNGCIYWSRCSVKYLVNCMCQPLMEDSKGALRSSWRSCRVASTRSTLVSRLTLLGEALVLLQSNLRNSCICWSRRSLDSLSNCRCKALVRVMKGALRSFRHYWRVAFMMSTLVNTLIMFVGPWISPRAT